MDGNAITQRASTAELAFELNGTATGDPRRHSADHGRYRRRVLAGNGSQRATTRTNSARPLPRAAGSGSACRRRSVAQTLGITEATVMMEAVANSAGGQTAASSPSTSTFSGRTSWSSTAAMNSARRSCRRSSPATLMTSSWRHGAGCRPRHHQHQDLRAARWRRLCHQRQQDLELVRPAGCIASCC